MSGLVIPAGVLVVLLLLGQVRIGLRGEYTADGVKAWARLGPVWIRLLPREKKKKPGGKQKSPPKPVKGEGKKTGLTPGGALDYARELLPLALEAAGRFRKKLRVDRLELELRSGAQDPADAAMAYGYANAALGALWLPLTQAFHVKDGTARVKLDFDARQTTLYARGAMSLKVGQALWLGLCFGMKGLRKIFAVKGRRSTKETERKAV